jgi:anaerobic magnesium-protoporphyrin IX monomethyl ester cyclase
MKLLLIQPPKRFWPYISEGDNYLLPQWMVCLAASARQAGYEVRCIDCAPRKTGWQSLGREIAGWQPDFVGVGENHALYADESLRALQLAKQINPHTVTIAGGTHFSNTVEQTLSGGFVDFIATREGEITLVDLMDAVRDGRDPETVQSVIFTRGGDTVYTPPRPLIEDLDSLPMPAYDLAGMHLYGNSRFLFSPGGATIYHSRGCVSNCRFCAWWLQMADVKVKDDGKQILKPRWRTKSVDYTVEEIELLANKHNKKCLVFVDEYWNYDSEWNAAFSEALIKKNLGVVWFAFMRADAIVRDEENGVLEKMVRSGMVHVCVGVEHTDADKLASMGKGFYSSDTSTRCFHILRDKYPGVFRQGTFIVGTRKETRESMLNQVRYARHLDLDYPGFHPITPVPGTDVWREYDENGWIEVKDYREYDWMTPIISSEFMTREEIEDFLINLSKRFVSPRWFLRGITSRSSYRRRMYVWWIIVTLRVIWDSIRRRIKPFTTESYSFLVKPEWYDD